MSQLKKRRKIFLLLLLILPIISIHTYKVGDKQLLLI